MGDEDEVNVYDGILPCQGRQGGMYPQVHNSHVHCTLFYLVVTRSGNVTSLSDIRLEIYP